VPLTLFVKALLIDSDPRSRWVGIFLSAGDSPVRDPDELDEDVLDELDQLDLDGDGVGEADPDHGRPVVERLADKAEKADKAEYAGAVRLEEGATDAPDDDHLVKGNEDSMKYHVPGSRWYDATVAEVWFASAEDAEAAGFAPAGGAADDPWATGGSTSFGDEPPF